MAVSSADAYVNGTRVGLLRWLDCVFDARTRVYVYRSASEHHKTVLAATDELRVILRSRRRVELPISQTELDLVDALRVLLALPVGDTRASAKACGLYDNIKMRCELIRLITELRKQLR